MSRTLEEAVDRSGRLLDLDYGEVAGALGVHESTLYRWRTGESGLSQRARSRTAALTHFLDRVEGLFSDAEARRSWLDAPLPGFGGQTPRQLVVGGRTELLTGYLEREAVSDAPDARPRSDRRNRLLAETGAIFAERSDPEEIVGAVTRLMTETVADFAIAYLLEEGGGLSRVARVHRNPRMQPLLEEFERRVPLTREHPLPTRIFESGEAILMDPVDVEALATGPEHARIIRELGPVSGIGVPLIGARGPLGIFAVSTVHGGRPAFDEEDRTTVTEIARRVALALENARLQRQHRRAREAAETRARRIAALQRATAALAGALTPEEVRGALVDDAASSLGSVGGALILASDDGESFDVIHSSATRPEEAKKEWSRFPVSPDRPSPAARVFRTGRPLFFSTPEEWRERYPHLGELLEELGGRSIAYVPVEVGPCRHGVLALRFPEERDFPEDERSLLVSLGHLAGQGLERARLFESEREAREEAEVASVARSQFLSVVSHELRTPLNAILGSASILGEGIPGELNGDQQDYIRRIKGGAEHLTSLIDEILAYSRADTGREEPSLSRVDVSTLAREVVEFLEPRAGEEDLDLELRVPDGTVEIVTDPGKLRHVLLNLLDNAIKFTDEGSVELAVEVGNDGVEVSVRDTGPGIPADARERIFEPFVQVDQSRTRTRGGTGLGLAVVARQVELLGGSVAVESERGRGSVFRVRHPTEVPR